MPLHHSHLRQCVHRALLALALPLTWLCLAPFVAAQPTPSPSTPSPSSEAPEADTGRTERALVTAKRHMVVAAHPLASQAGRDMLRAGGNALDAAIAAQMVLNVVEPQSSGLGGGGFLIYYDHKTERIAAWDGRETAPAAATPERFIAANGRPMRFIEAIGSGLSVGVPGVLAMLAAAHHEQGRLPWPSLFAPAIRIAEAGFPISPRLASLIASDPLLPGNAETRELFFSIDGKPRRAGDPLRNPQLAEVLRRVAAQGPDAFYRGDIARDMVAAVRAAARPGDLTEADLASYHPVRRDAVCGAYRGYRVCGMPPPSSGGITVAMMLALLERFPMQRLRPDSLEAAHLFAEAGHLAYADRDRYLADPDFVPAPVTQLLDPYYLAKRSAMIRSDRSMGMAAPGTFEGVGTPGEDHTLAQPATTHMSIVDGEGNAVAFTSSVESAFGSRLMVRGFLLNNQLTDFSLLPSVDGVPAANRVAPGKRPRSSMAPTLVFDANRRLRYVLGSPGGNMIINYVAKTLVGLIDWKQDAQAAAGLPNLGSRNRQSDLEVERGTVLERLAPQLGARGHTMRVTAQTSGVNVIAITPPTIGRTGGTLNGGSDPRREGVALGD